MRTHGLCFFFFFQAEDGIRDVAVTGVQTCALPILLPRASPVLPSARKPGARSFALRRFAVSADCGQPTAASAAMARWPSLRRWTRSGPWLAAPKIAREFLPPLPGTIQKTAVRLPSTRPLSRTRLRLKCASYASAGFTMPGTLSMAEAQGPLRQQDQS